MSGAATMAADDLPTARQYDGFIGWVLGLMSDLGEVGVGLALAIETIFPPVPSEVVLPAAGFLSYSGEMSLALVLVSATAGSMLGGYVYYFAGAAFGRRRTRRLFERLPLFEVRDFERAERLFARWGAVAVLVGRCLPVVRSVISLPAGIERMPIWKFSVYTLLGSAVWNSVLVGLGFAFGPQVEPVLTRYSDVLSRIVLGVIGGLALWFVVSRAIKRVRNGPGGDSGADSSTDETIRPESERDDGVDARSSTGPGAAAWMA